MCIIYEAELFGLLLKKAKPDIDVRVLRVRLSGFFVIISR